jgi:ribosomal protein L31E
MKVKRLPKSTNGTRRSTYGGSAYKFQKEELKRRARAEGVTVSYYLHTLLWKDWLEKAEKGTPRKYRSARVLKIVKTG